METLTLPCVKTECETKSPMRVAVINNNDGWVKCLLNLYKGCNDIELFIFNYPIDIDQFRTGYDVILVDLLLGGMNGANVVSNLFRKGIKGKMLVLVDSYDPRIKDFSSCISKKEIEEDPNVIFSKCNKIDLVDQAVETVMLLQWIKP